MIKCENINKVYKNFPKKTVVALDDVSIHIGKREIVGIFGKSGSGKSTIANILAGIIPYSSGKILFDNNVVKYPIKGKLRSNIQIVFQKPEASFNPSWTLKKSIIEPFKLHNIPISYEDLLLYLSNFGIYEQHLNRYIHSLSGGELQRANLARVLAINPSLLILDEPTSMLDHLSTAQIIHILKKYNITHNISYLFISHKFDIIERFCDKCYFIENGKIVDCQSMR